MDQHTLTNGTLTARVLAKGAELASLRDAAGNEVIWQAGPAWPKHSPVLFPIIGKLAGDRMRVDGRDHALPKHGFARDRMFRWVETGPESCLLELVDDDQTRALYPFAFKLQLGYRLEGDALLITYRVENRGEGLLPASLGAHPAFRWPLLDGVAKTEHRIEFETDEPGALKRVTPDGLIGPEPKPSPVRGRVLALDESLFADDALVWDPVASRSVTYTAPGCPVVEVSWDGFPQLGIWSRPADFVCVEPWHGIADPEGFDGEFRDKPGLMHIPAGEGRDFSIRVRIG